MKTLLLCLLSLNAIAAFPLLKFDELNGEFIDGKGVASAKSAKYDLQQVKIAHNEIEVKFNRKEKNLVIMDQNTTVELVFDFSFLNVFKSFGFSGVSVESTNKKFDLLIDQIDVHIEPKTYKAEHIFVTTDLTAVSTDELPGDDYDILDGFILNGAVAFKRLSFGKVDANNLQTNLIDENPLQEEDIKESLKGLGKIPLSLKNFSLGVVKGKITGKVLLDSWINANVYIGGKLNHKVKENKLEIVLTKAKLGYFSIKGLVLKEISKLKIEAITVKGNLIEVDLGKVLSSSIPRNSKL